MRFDAFSFGSIQIDDIVAVVDMLLGLSRTASITKIAMTRSGASGYGA